MSKIPILLYAVSTPNGEKVSIFLEELKEEYGQEYEFRALDLTKQEQKEDWFLKVCNIISLPAPGPN